MFAQKSRTIMPLALLAAVAMTCLQGAAFAGEVPMEPSLRVEAIPVGGLDLADPQVQARLDARIRTAARNVCRPENLRDLKAIAERPACERAAVEAALARRDMLVARAEANQMARADTRQPGAN